MHPNTQARSHHDIVEHHHDEPPLKPLEILQSASSAEGMPIEWVFDRANLLSLNFASLSS